MIRIHVNCTSGYRAEETPRQIRLGNNVIDVERVLDRWLSPDHRYFKILGSDGSHYIVRCHHECYGWELMYYRTQADGEYYDKIKT